MNHEKQRLSATPVKLPPELKNQLKHAAIDNRRSLSNEIVYRLEHSQDFFKRVVGVAA